MLPHPRDSAAPARFDQGPIDCHRLGDRRGRKAKLGGGKDGALFATPVVVAQVDDLAIGPDEGISNMRMGAACLGMQNAASRLICKAKFGLEMPEKDTDCVRVVPSDGRINVQVI